MDREMGIFLEVFHRVVLPTTQEQERYRSRRETRQIMDLLDRLPKKDDYSASGMGATADSAIGNERLLMPQILNGLKKNEFIFLLQPQYELNTRKIIGAEAWCAGTTRRWARSHLQYLFRYWKITDILQNWIRRSGKMYAQ